MKGVSLEWLKMGQLQVTYTIKVKKVADVKLEAIILKTSMYFSKALSR